jgi:hypothetical protein
MAVTDGTNAGFVTSAPTSDPAGGNRTQNYYADCCAFMSPAGSNQIIQMGWYCDTASEEANFQLGLYDDNADTPGTLLATTGDIAKGTDAGWKTGALDYTLLPDTKYWLAIQLDNTTTTTYNNADTNASYKLYTKANQTSLPSGSWDGYTGRILAIYALYEASAETYQEQTQDTNIIAPIGTNVKLRMLINATGDPDSGPYELQYRYAADGANFTDWTKVNS